MEKFVIQSDNKGLAAVEKYVSVFCDEKHIHNYFATISTSVLQAVENAIVHGNNSDVTKQVTVECGDYCGGIYFTIEDQGNGFDVSQYGDLPKEDTKGEGIFLMKTLADNLEFSNGGRCVRLEFAIQGIETDDTVNRIKTLDHFYSLKQVNA